MDQDRAITATFGRPKGTKITKARIKARKRSASFSFTAPGAITGFQCVGPQNQIERSFELSDGRSSTRSRSLIVA
jgi:hypothetical protein